APRATARARTDLPAPSSPRNASTTGGCAISPIARPHASSSGSVSSAGPSTVSPTAATSIRARPARRAARGRPGRPAQSRLHLEQLVTQHRRALEIQHRRRFPHLLLEDLRPLLEVDLVAVTRRRLLHLCRRY